MIKKTSSNQPCGGDSEYLTGAFLKSFSIFLNQNICCGYLQNRLGVWTEVKEENHDCTLKSMLFWTYGIHNTVLIINNENNSEVTSALVAKVILT